MEICKKNCDSCKIIRWLKLIDYKVICKIVKCVSKKMCHNSDISLFSTFKKMIFTNLITELKIFFYFWKNVMKAEAYYSYNCHKLSLSSSHFTSNTSFNFYSLYMKITIKIFSFSWSEVSN